MNIIEQEMDTGLLCDYWELGGYRAGLFILGAMSASHGELLDELYWLHTIWFIRGGL